ncbi:leucine-rich repeat-containing protein 70-like [Limulus polyphemus]|uniref:Leucine-rich repeat-containing protein 70-like n=1 Tax=Limulus polyphemus TaxID=6850 RepID=A0ABM1B2H7_LIMPO|nr:leucine-rich repeat-containing protein 70-like [Limulus polyphemus]XP_022240440.1 leucine-rich repeat-containing protein 70-like [Limulus polyphemus]
MQRLRGSPGIIVLLFYFICIWKDISGLCPVSCDCDDGNLRAFCNFAKLDVIPITLNPHLKYLSLNNNRIKTTMLSLGVYRNLEHLDISHNELVKLTPFNFIGLRSLQLLNLSSNLISELNNETFLGLESLTELFLDHNLLQSIPDSVFTKLRGLKKLDLSMNRISTILQDSFQGLNNLEYLSLRSSKLTFIPSESFHSLKNLLTLDLGLNSFPSIPENSFSFLNKLTELILDNCGIQEIVYGAFKWLNALKILRLEKNELSEIPTKPLFDVIYLEEIYLGQNKFSTIKSRSFQRLQYLRVIDISDTATLNRVEADSFADNKNLERIVMNYNKKLNYIDASTFRNLHELQEIHLRGNSFQSFDQDLISGGLKVLDIRDNPLVCACDMLWLATYLRAVNLSFSSEEDFSKVRCASPSNLKDKILRELTQSDLGCTLKDHRRPIITGIIVVAVVIMVAIAVVGFKYRKKVTGTLKSRWNTRKKETKYHKTGYLEEDDTILQAAQRPLKIAPVTEL